MTMQQRWSRAQLLIVDEKSMVGRAMWGKTDSRLRQIFASGEPLGNTSTLLFGDFGQLPPVGDTPKIHHSTPTSAQPLLSQMKAGLHS